MLNQETTEKLMQMRLRGMAEALREQKESADLQLLTFEERLGMLIDRQWTWRENLALDRRLRNGRLQGPACVEDIDYRTPRGLDRQLVRSLTAESAWVRDRQNLFVTGATGVGKTWLARAFAHKACRDGYTALFVKALELFRNLATARADGSHSKALYQLTKVELLVMDDWAMAPMSDPERRDFLEICDGRYQNRATLLTSQMPVEAWHKQIGDPTIADSILDRLVHNAHRIKLSGESLRKERGGVKPPAKKD
ncbi:MAG: ATP-binding protein [Bryobacteraceae bacterium]|nr:ATP-binding protein [Bryobacteraceae bacterium]